MARRSGFDTGELADAAVHVLLALVRPRHGYAVSQFLEAESAGTVVVGPASLYTTLKKLSAAGFIEELDAEDARRTYQLTAVGRDVLERNIERRRQLLAMADRIMEDS
ncbi:MAG: PadR family transcriptional regulator [Brachybacterium sp.]|uniref:PadR family transcriptional regulator n=1 Tax=unclassified Brachybacterium TaxID=2623841 RepID=UPI003F9360C8